MDVLNGFVLLFFPLFKTDLDALSINPDLYEAAESDLVVESSGVL